MSTFLIIALIILLIPVWVPGLVCLAIMGILGVLVLFDSWLDLIYERRFTLLKGKWGY